MKVTFKKGNNNEISFQSFCPLWCFYEPIFKPAKLIILH